MPARRRLPSAASTAAAAALTPALAVAMLAAALLAAPVAAEPAGPAPAAAPDCPEPVPVPASLVEAHLAWIAAQTGYDVAPVRETPPEIVFCEIGEEIDYENARILVEPELRAAYDLAHARIYLVAPWSATDPFDSSVLLHELIHAVQLANREWACIGAPEWEAYKLQEAWLAERGIDPGFDWLAIFMASRCPRDIHP